MARYPVLIARRLRQWTGISVFGTVRVFDECIDDNALIENPMEDPAVPSEKQVVEMTEYGKHGKP